jgi:hypothetical protein
VMQQKRFREGREGTPRQEIRDTRPLARRDLGERRPAEHEKRRQREPGGPRRNRSRRRVEGLREPRHAAPGKSAGRHSNAPESG